MAVFGFWLRRSSKRKAKCFVLFLFFFVFFVFFCFIYFVDVDVYFSSIFRIDKKKIVIIYDLFDEQNINNHTNKKL